MIIRKSLFAMFVIGIIFLVSIVILSITQEKNIVYGCSPDFWKNNLELWKNLGVDYNDDFDKTFGKDYFEPDITLQQAIRAEGVGINHLARSGTAAYLNALVDPGIDETAVKTAIYFGYIHDIDKLNEHCEKQYSSHV
jgi:hypothetical protein